MVTTQQIINKVVIKMGRSRSKRRFFQKVYSSGIEYNHWLMKFASNAISSYRVEGLPKEIDSRWLALKLFELGSVAFFYDSDADEYACMQYSCLGTYDCYGNPTKIRVWNTWTGYQRELGKDEFVIIWDNMLRINMYNAYVELAYRLWRIDGTIDTNCVAQKTPVIVQCSENERLTFKNLLAGVDADNPYLAVGDNLSLKDIKALQLGAPLVAPQLMEVQQTLYNRGNALLGITSVIVQKKERMVKSEVDTANADALANRRSRTMARDYASLQIKEKFGLDVTWIFDNGDEPNKETGDGNIEDFISTMKADSLGTSII